MKLLCFNRAFNLQKRKVSLKPHLDPKFHSLTSPSNQITQYLFGDNLEQKVSDIYKVSQAARNPRFQAVRFHGSRYARSRHGHRFQNNRRTGRTFYSRRSRDTVQRHRPYSNNNNQRFHRFRCSRPQNMRGHHQNNMRA